MRPFFVRLTFSLISSLHFFCAVSMAQSASNDDPSLFHFGASYQMLHGQYQGIDYVESCAAQGTGKVSTIKFKDYIYVSWPGVTGSVNIACIGSTHLKELTQENIAANRNVYHGIDDSLVGRVFTNYSPSMVVFYDKLFVLYNNVKDNKISYLCISDAGTVNISERGVLDNSPTDFIEFEAIAVNNTSFCLYGNTQNSGNIRQLYVQKNIFAPYNYSVFWDKKISESCIGRVGVCQGTNSNTHLIAWTGLDKGHQLNTAFIDIYNASIWDKHTYNDHSSHVDGPLLFRKENNEDNDVHILWRGANDDTKIWQGVFNINNKNSFQQFSLPTNIAVANVTPALISLNGMITYMFWPTANASSLFYANIMMAKALDYPYDEWMGKLIKDEHTLKNLVLPGSNNAGMNDVMQASHFPSVYQALEIPDLGDCNECGFLTQLFDIKKQMELGYRYFGLNISDYTYTPSQIGNNVYYPDGNLLHSSVQPLDHVSSTCLGQGFEDILKDARDFLKSHPKELVIINIKDLNPDALSIHSIMDDLEKVLPQFKDILFAKQSYQKNLGDIINERIGDLRGKIILTAADTFLADKNNMLRDIFEISHDNANRYINTTNTSVNNLAHNQTNFFSNPKYNGSYKRMDWQVNLTWAKLACDLKPLKSCFEQPKPGLWHHITHIVGCAAEVAEMGYTVFKAVVEPEDPRSWITIAGWIVGLTNSSSLAHVQEANKQLYPTVYDLEHSNTLNKNNMVNIIYTDASDYLYTDLCMQLVTDFNDYDEVSAHNGHFSISDEHISVTCAEPNSGIASIKVSGGHPPYKYYWESTGDSTATTDSLSEGYHKVIIIDAMEHQVTKKVYVSMNANAHSGLADNNSSKTEFQGLGTTNHFEVDCDKLIVKIESNHSSTGVQDSIQTKVWIEAQNDGLYCQRHYELLPQKDEAIASGKITLYFTQNDFDRFNQSNPMHQLPKNPNDAKGISNVMLLCRIGASADGSGSYNSYEHQAKEIFPKKENILWNPVAKRWEISFHSHGFGGYFLTTHEGSLPNKWILADAYMQDGMPYIHWQVQERAIDRYHVEYSFDNKNYWEVGSEASLGQGQHSYHKVHTKLQFPIEFLGQEFVYYRIRQIDNDGFSNFSRTIHLNIGKSNKIMLYPNPCSEQINVLSTAAMDLYIVDLMGKSIAIIPLNKGTNTLNTSTWIPGVYLAKTKDGECHKIIKI